MKKQEVNRSRGWKAIEEDKRKRPHRIVAHGAYWDFKAFLVDS